MKNILLFIIFCALGYFVAPHLGRTAKSEFANRGVYEQAESEIYQTVSIGNGRYLAVGSYAVLLDVDKAASVAEPEKLFTIYGNARELGLMLTPEGIIGNWLGNTWTDPWAANKVVSLAALEKRTPAMRIGKKKYLPLVIVSNASFHQGDAPAGFSIMDRKGNMVLHFPTLCTAENESFKSVEFNPDFIAYAEPQARMLVSKLRVSRALSKLIKEVKAANEPQMKSLIGAGIGGLLALVIMIATRKPKAKKAAH